MHRRTLLQTLGGLPALGLGLQLPLKAPLLNHAPWTPATVDALLDFARQEREPASLLFGTPQYADFRMFGRDHLDLNSDLIQLRAGFMATYKGQFEVWIRRGFPSNFVAVLDSDQKVIAHQGRFTPPHLGEVCQDVCAASLCEDVDHPQEACPACRHQKWLREAPSESALYASAQWIFTHTTTDTLLYQKPNRRWRWEVRPGEFAVILQNECDERDLARLKRRETYTHDGRYEQLKPDDRVFRRPGVV